MPSRRVPTATAGTTATTGTTGAGATNATNAGIAFDAAGAGAANDASLANATSDHQSPHHIAGMHTVLHGELSGFLGCFPFDFSHIPITYRYFLRRRHNWHNTRFLIPKYKYDFIKLRKYYFCFADL